MWNPEVHPPCSTTEPLSLPGQDSEGRDEARSTQGGSRVVTTKIFLEGIFLPPQNGTCQQIAEGSLTFSRGRMPWDRELVTGGWNPGWQACCAAGCLSL